MADGRKLDRILRVRTLQLDLVRAKEVDARGRFEQEQELRQRIAQLADNVAPTEAQESATALRAAAHYRERLHVSAFAAERRVEVAERGLDAAQAATREAKRDQTAVEKLIARADAQAVIKALRDLEELPPSGKNRHDIC